VLVKGDLMRDVYVAGVGMTPFGKFMHRSVRSMAEEATAEALRDAGFEAGSVEMAFFAHAVGGVLTGQEMIRGQVALRHSGILGIPLVNVENACASASSAFHLGWMAVASGSVEVALVVGSEKLTHPDKEMSFAAIGTAVDLAQRDELQEQLLARSSDEGGVDAPTPPGSARSFFMDIYAEMARRYMRSSGATARDFAQVAVKSHRHGALNPKAQYRSEVTIEEVLGSRTVADPLTLLMCAPIGDGAAAAVLCSRPAVQRLSADTVRVASTVLVSGRDRAPGELTAVERASRRAYELAGIGPEDLDVVEVHDAAATVELSIYEELGLCPPGGGPKLLASEDTGLGGRIPVNPSGGLLSRGHPIGATGCAQLVELVDQLRGRCGARQVDTPRVAMAENAGGFLGADPAAVVITILTR